MRTTQSNAQALEGMQELNSENTGGAKLTPDSLHGRWNYASVDAISEEILFAGLGLQKIGLKPEEWGMYAFLERGGVKIFVFFHQWFRF